MGGSDCLNANKASCDPSPAQFYIDSLGSANISKHKSEIRFGTGSGQPIQHLIRACPFSGFF